MARYIFWDPSKWYRYSPPRDEDFDVLSQPEKEKRRKKRRRASAAVRRHSRAGSLVGSRAGSRAGSLAPSMPVPHLVPQPPPPHQRHDAVSRGSLAMPMEPAQHAQSVEKSRQRAEAGNQYQPLYLTPGQTAEVGYQYGPLPPVMWPPAYQDPQVLATGEVYPLPTQVDYADATTAATGGQWPMIYDSRKVVGSRPRGRERHITGICVLCAACLFCMFVAGLMILFNVDSVIPLWVGTKERTPFDLDDLTREDVSVIIYPLRPTTNQTTQPVGFQTANTIGPRYIDRYHRTACVFHASADGLEAVSPGGRTRFGLSLFPFALCRVALFCCPSLAANVEPGEEHSVPMMAEFASRARITGFVEPLMMLGDGSQSSQMAFEQLLYDLEESSLPDTVGSWYKRRKYAGVVLRFPEEVSADTWLRIPHLLGQLAQKLAASPGLNVRLGVALRQDAQGADLRGLAAMLGQVSVFLLPPAMPLERYTGNTFSYYSESTLASLSQLYSNHFMPDQAQTACYLLPADTYTFQTASRTNHTPIPVQHSLRAGIQGPVTMVPGRMAYFESCRVVVDQSYVRADLKYGVVASRGDSWLSYTKPHLLGRFADALHDNASATCLGLWNPHWDDFASFCGEGAYPYARTLFRHYFDVHP